MKKRFCLSSFLVMACMVFLLFIGCNKSKSTTATSPVESNTKSDVKAIAQKDPIIIDWRDFNFTSGYNVPGTIFQANFLWGFQDGKHVNVKIEGTTHTTNFQNAPQRYNFKENDPVTVVFKVTSELFTHLLDIVSIDPR